MNASRYVVGIICCMALAACDIPIPFPETPPVAVAQPDDNDTQESGDSGGEQTTGGAAARSQAGATRTSGRPQASTLDATRFDGPTVIRSGGTYTGNWESTDPSVPAVRIATTEPVIIDGARIRSRGHLIASSTSGIDLTVRNTVGVGVDPGRSGQTAGRFAFLLGARRVTIANNDLIGTSGIVFGGYGGNGTTRDTFKVVRNRARNIEGRVSDGSRYSSNDSSAELTQFVQFSEVHDVPGIEVAWNDVLNEPGASRAEDVISVYLSSGTPDSPIRIHDNFVEGAYPANPASDRYSGGGIMLGDGRAAPQGVRHVVAARNHVVNTTNHGMAISAGEHVTVKDNRVLSTGRLPDGSAIAAQNVGIYVWNYHGQPAFGDTEVSGNVVGWERGKGGDYWLPDVTRESGNTTFRGTVTDAVIDDEYAGWRRRAADTDVAIGAGQ